MNNRRYIGKTFRNVVPGLNVTISDKGVGWSIGAKGQRIGKSSAGNTVVSSRLPGGIQYRERLKRAPQQQQQEPFSKHSKAYYVTGVFVWGIFIGLLVLVALR